MGAWSYDSIWRRKAKCVRPKLTKTLTLDFWFEGEAKKQGTIGGS